MADARTEAHTAGARTAANMRFRDWRRDAAHIQCSATPLRAVPGRVNEHRATAVPLTIVPASLRYS